MKPSFARNSYDSNGFYQANFSAVQGLNNFNGSSSHKLFAEPRDLNRIVDEPRKFGYIQPANRICSPKRKLFQQCRENTKPAAPTIPQIDLSKPARNYEFEIPNSERQLFQKPREIMNKYSEIEGSHPHQTFNSARGPNRYFEDNLLPNKPKLFQQPRQLGVECDGCHSKPQIDLKSPPRSSDRLVQEARKNLFSKPRDINRIIPENRRVYVTRPTHDYVEPPVPERVLFKQPREIMKYSEVEGSSPRQFFPSVARPNYLSQDQMKGILY